MQKYSDVVLDRAGNAIARALVYVYNAGSGTLATIYSDNSSTAQSNPMQSDSDGAFAFYAANGRYDIKTVHGGSEKWDYDKLLDDPSGSLAIWVDSGDTPIYINATSFKVTSDRTSFYTVGRTLKIVDSGTYYGVVASSSYSSPYTTVTAVLYSGAISSSISAVSASLHDQTEPSIPSFEVNVFNFLTDAEKADWLAGTALLDVTTNLRKAFVAFAQVTSSSTGSPASGSKPTLRLPRGRCTITGDLSNGLALNYLTIKAENTIIEAAAGITAIGNLRYMVDIDGLTIRGGAVAYGVATGNVDTTLIRIKNGECVMQTSACISVDNNSASTQLIVDNTKLCPASGGKVLSALSGDSIQFNGCWTTPQNSGGAAFDVTNVRLTLNGLLGVPGGTLSWVDLRGSSRVHAKNCRFGGEGGGADYIVRCYTSADTSYPQNPTGIRLEGGECYAKTSLVQFFALPNYVYIDVDGLIDTLPLRFDSTISAADIAAIASVNWEWRVKSGVQPYSLYADPTSTPAAAVANGVPLTNWYGHYTGHPNTADLVLQSAADTASYTPSQSTSNATPASVSDAYGVATKQYTATANNASFSMAYTSALNGLSAAIYTAVFDIEVTSDHTIWPRFTASNVQYIERPIPRGKHTVCVPFYYDGGSAKSVILTAARLPSGAVVQWRRFRIYSGVRHITTDRAVVIGSSAPASGQWYRGDLLEYAQPSAGGFMGEVCTTAGSPGTWKTREPISA